ncbi:hypothetical protein HMPREF9989_01107 [Staphylococcus epidermidis NIHLM057]|nr:hypothetical protein HMPREF9989_01107 [Staphylococcus epidermidis NIHLM057]
MNRADIFKIFDVELNITIFFRSTSSNFHLFYKLHEQCK